jgi:hypothetical protein
MEAKIRGSRMQGRRAKEAEALGKGFFHACGRTLPSILFNMVTCVLEETPHPWAFWVP